MTRKGAVPPLILILLLIPVLFLPALSGPIRDNRTAWAGSFTATPSAGVENGGLAFGGNLRYFFVPNLAAEIDGAYGESVCQDCRLSETTLTANLVYAIHPADRLTLFLAAGGGAGFFDLSRPLSSQGVLSLFDAGGGATLRIGNRVGLTVENRWFLPLSGNIPDVLSGSLTASRWFLGLTTEF
jgi:hypothetical protein